MRHKIYNIALLFSFIVCVGCTHLQNSVEIKNLRCEYLENPIGIDVPQPRFTWEIQSGGKDIVQTTYQVRIASSPGLLENENPDIWQSEKISEASLLAILSDEGKLQSFTKYYWNVSVWINSAKNPVTSATASFETAMMNKTDWAASWISDGNNKETEPAPLFRKSIEIENKEIDFARMYITGLGYYEAFINGQRVGENYLDPGYTAFDKRVYYVTHDVTSLLKLGKNTIATVLGNGWYNTQSIAVWNFHNAQWRNRPRMMCEIHVHYKDGSIEKTISDEMWKTATGAYIYDNIYSGDMIDARLEEKGWKTTDFDDSNWENASIISDFSPILQAQLFPAIQITKEIPAVNMHRFSDSLYVFDFGENFAGFCKIDVKGEKGAKITLKHGEMLDSLGRLEQNNVNVFYHPVQEKEKFQADIFILRGDAQPESFQPAFTYHGFQYVEVESDTPITLTENSVTGLFVHTNVKPVGHFECSDETLNKLWAATNQSFLSNLHGIPTDCPQREKNGWTADAHVAIEAGFLNFDAITVYEKWMRDFIDNQREDGRISGIIPSAGWGYDDWIGPIWDAALFIVPDEIYNFYGTTRTIEELYPTMEKYLAYLQTREKDGVLNYGISDWLTFKTTTPNDFTTTVYYYIDNVLMAKFANLLGKDASAYAAKANTLKKTINEKFYHSETFTYSNGSQTALALALYAEIVPQGDEQKVADKLAEIIRANNGFLDFGLLGTKAVPRMLTKYGYGEMALKMITRPEAPSWGHWVEKLGYTTLPETWTMHPELKDGSLNHVFFGDVSAWMYQYLAGINYDKAAPGFQHILISPNFINGIDWVKAEYHSVRGLIRSEWKREGGKITLKVEIPAGARASVNAGGKVEQIGSGEYVYQIK